MCCLFRHHSRNRRAAVVIVFALLLGVNFAVRHLKMSDLKCNMKCANPQARVLRVTKLIKGDHLTVLPYRIVLHRCDEQTGCCEKNEQVCQEDDFEDLNITILVKDGVHYKPKSYEVKNHTKCKCQ